MPLDDIVDELVGAVDYDLSALVGDLKEIIEALKAGNEKKALKLAEEALAFLEPQLSSDKDSSCDGLDIKKPKRKKASGTKAKGKKPGRK